MTSLKNLFDTYKNSVLNKDVSTFCSIFDENIHVFDMWGQWSLEGITAWRAMAEEWLSTLGTDRVVVDFDDVHETVKGDLAYASAFLTFTAIDPSGKKLRSLQNRLSWVAEKKSGQWKIIHEHTSSPIHHETMKAILTR